jgi:hypothetical protein
LTNRDANYADAKPARKKLPASVSALSIFYAPPSVAKLFVTTASCVKAVALRSLNSRRQVLVEKKPGVSVSLLITGGEISVRRARS